jgi:hypothetical protein
MEQNKMKPTIRIHNIETDEVIDREMTNDEFAQYQADQEAEANRKAEAAAKEAARQELLDKLGITAEEAKLLLGGN